MSGLCRQAGISRQAYHRGRRQRAKQARSTAEVLAEVRCERLDQPRIGTRKLQGLLRQKSLVVGRDWLFAMLRAEGMLVAPKRRKVRTTYFDANLPVYRNLLYQFEPTQPEEVWVSDITYIATDEGNLYLSLITDRVSRRIVGWHAGAQEKSPATLPAQIKFRKIG